MRELADLPEVAAAFGDLADLKTPYLHGHAAGVADLAAGAAARGGLDDAAVERLRVAALLHDLGRVGVPNAIWEKAGPLTRAEWEAVRLHAYRSERILAGSPTLAPMAPLAGMHHERLDGSGYHRACGAGEIPMAARILAAADAFQAMTQRRPHRPARAPDAAAAELRRDARAGRLDPDAVAAVLDAAGPGARAGGRPAPRRPHRPRGRGARPGRRGLLEPRGRRAPAHLAAHRRAPRPARLRQDRRLQPRRRGPLRPPARPAARRRRLSPAARPKMGRSAHAAGPPPRILLSTRVATPRRTRCP